MKFSSNLFRFIVYLFFLSFFFFNISFATTDTTPSVIVHISTLKEIFNSLTYPALVKAKVHATVLSDVDGIIKTIHAPLGSQIKSGGKIVTIQQTDPIFQFAPVAMTSPVFGIISELDLSEGSRVIKGQKLASVINPQSLKVSVEVPAQDLIYLKQGMDSLLELPVTDRPLKLIITGISPHVDPATGTASIELEPKKEEIRFLRPGMIGKITLKANLHKGFLVPQDSLVFDQNKTFLRIVEDGKMKKLPVIVGSKMYGQIEILSGIKEGSQIIQRSSGFISEGQTVKIEETTNNEPKKGI